MKEKLLMGESVIGTFFNLGGNTAAEALGISGLDFFIVDCEHGPFDVESSMDFIRAAEPKGITPLVRIKDITRASVLKMLDIGAKGLIVPCVETAEQVKQLVEYGKYYPKGKRGFAFSRAGEFGFAEFAEDINEYFNTCNDKTMIIPQCETMGCLENIEEITNIDGIDGIFVGPYDLSIAMGKPGQFSDPDFINALNRIVKACRDAGKFVLIYAGDSTTSRKYIENGFNGVAVGMDVVIYINAFKNIINEIRS
ncbi:MAG: HpcH/HpaI aldolase family protein [Solirubrobacterales bacterium]